MKISPVLNWLCGTLFGLLLAVPVGAADPENADPKPFAPSPPPALVPSATNAPSEPQVSAAEMRELFRAYLQLQQQLHDALLAIEQNRREAAETASRSTESVNASLRQLQTTFSTQRAQDIHFLEKSHRSVVALAGVFAGSALLALVAAAWLQLRAINRLAEVASTVPSPHLLPHSTTAAALDLGSGVGVETDQASARLREAVQTLQNRISELEHTAGAHHHSQNAASTGHSDEASDRITVLLGKGQTLLHLNDPEGALNCFDEAMNEDPANPDVLIKKGTALEKLGRLEEAIRCYDRAIELDEASTLAYLYKGGVYNQLERFNEALQCYEQALRAQQKTHTETTTSA